MKKALLSTRVAIALVGTLSVDPAAQLAGQQSASSPVEVGVSPSRLLDMAVSRVMPEYPSASLAKGVEGVVVSQVFVANGRIQRVDLLQAPNEEIGVRVREALMKWVFKNDLRAPDGAPAMVRSKVMIYFGIRNGKGIVRTSAEMIVARETEGKPIAGTGPSAPYPTIYEPDWLRLQKQGPVKAVLLDVRDRDSFRKGHLNGALNIPENELSVRAPAELSKTTPLVVDCPTSSGDLCSYAAPILQRLGFTKVSMLKRDSR